MHTHSSSRNGDARDRHARSDTSGSRGHERESRKRQNSRSRDPRASEKKARKSVSQNGGVGAHGFTTDYTKSEKRRLADFYEQAKQETDEPAVTGDEREMKFRLQVGAERSPYIYGRLEKLRRGEKQSAVERNTYFLDENIEWQYLPGDYRCVPTDSTSQNTYDTWARRLHLIK